MLLSFIELELYNQTGVQSVNVEEQKYTILELPKLSHLPGENAFSVLWFRNENFNIVDSVEFYQTLDNDLAVLSVPLNNNGNNFSAKAKHLSFVPSYRIIETSSPTFNMRVTGN